MGCKRACLAGARHLSQRPRVLVTLGTAGWLQSLTCGAFGGASLADNDTRPAPGDDGMWGCYTLSGCEADTSGEGLDCECVTVNAADVYACEGYRLPTEAEWERRARDVNVP